MEFKQKPLFELPKLITLDGHEVTEDTLLSEVHPMWNACLKGGNSCTGGGANTALV